MKFRFWACTRWGKTKAILMSEKPEGLLGDINSY